MIIPLIPEFLSHARSQVPPPTPPANPGLGKEPPPPVPPAGGGTHAPPCVQPVPGPRSQGGCSEITRISSTLDPAARPLWSPLPAGLAPLSTPPPHPAGSVIRLPVPLSRSYGPVIRPRAGPGAPARRGAAAGPSPSFQPELWGPRAEQGQSRLRAASQAGTAAGGGPAVSQRGRPGRAAGGGGAEDALRPGAGRRRRRGRGRLRAL